MTEETKPTWPVLTFPSELEITEQLVIYADPVKQVEEGAKAFETIEDDETFDKAAQYALDCNTVEKRIDERRKKIVDEPNKFVKRVNGLLNGYIGRINTVRDKVQRTAFAYKKARDEAERKRQEEERLKKENEALERAKRLQDAGNVEAANQLLDIAASAPKVATARASFGGGTAFDRGRWTGVVKDKASVLRAAIEGRFPMDAITIGQAAINEKAREIAKETVIDGIQYTKAETLGVRGR